MGMINPTLDDRVRFTLYNDNLDPLVITDPVNWNSDEKETARNSKYDGVYSQFSNSLKFLGSGADFIVLVDELYGVNADIRLVKEEKHPRTDIWTKSYDTFLDLSTMKVKDGKVEIKANAGGLEKRIKSRESEKLELERLTTLDGEKVDPLKIDKLAVSGREVFLDSLLKVKEVDKDNALDIRASDGYNIRQTTIPFTVDYKSDDLIHSTYSNQWYEGGSLNTGAAETMIYAINDRRKTLHFHVKLDCIIKVQSMSPAPSGVTVGVDLIIYNGAGDYSRKQTITLYEVPNPYNMHNHKISIDWKQDIELLEGESIAIVWRGDGYFSGALFKPNDYLYLDFEVNSGSVSIKEDSFYESSNSNVLLPFEALERLLLLITGRDDVLYSEVLGRTDLGYDQDGEVAYVGLAHGFWFRNFNQGDELYKGITLSLKDFLESYLNVWNLGMGIERVGFTERIRIEKKSYFYNRNTTVRLGNMVDGVVEYVKVKDLEISKDADLYYSSVEVGYEKPSGDRLYDEAVGLIEYNGLNTYTTCIDRVTNTLKLISPIRADLMGAEFARRKPKESFPTADTSYDNDVFMLDMKKSVTSLFELCTWEDHFEEPPGGTYSPETAGNLRLSPFNILLRNGSEISGCLTKYPYEYIRYANSTANSNLETKLIGGEKYKENQEDGIIRNNLLPKARFLPEVYKFEYPVDFDLTQIIQGNSNILGKLVPNMYGLIAFQDKNGSVLRGFLENLKPNGNGKWELKKYNR
jgi:hypothetical protein